MSDTDTNALTLEEIYRKAAYIALDGQNGEHYFIEKAHAQGVDIPPTLWHFYTTQLKRYRWVCWKARLARGSMLAILLLSLAFCVGLILP